MSISATGRVVVVDESGDPWGPREGLKVIGTDISALFDEELDRQPTGADGQFTLHYDEDTASFPGSSRRTLVFEVVDKVGRRLARLEREDVATDVLEIGDVVISRVDATGYLVTLGTGIRKLLSTGNAVRLLVDNDEAWGHLSDLILNATKDIRLMQLAFEVPAVFHADPSDEDPVMVLRFYDSPASPALSADALRPLDRRDKRPERILWARAFSDHRVDVKLLLHRNDIDWHIIGAGAVFAGAGALVALVLGHLLSSFGVLTSYDEVDYYYHRSIGRPITVRGAPTSWLAVTHAKLAIVDGAEAVSIASPLMQAYFGDPRHAVDDPRRGFNDGLPVHDVSISVRGPAVAHLHEAFRLHWNAAVPDEDAILAIDPPEPELSGEDPIASVQVVRTLTPGRFADPADGEKGILEAYLRAIASAKRWLYLENQYLTNETIGSALVEALKDEDRPDLEVIALINIDPDIPFYRGWQRDLIARIREEVGETGQQRFGVFTRWTHEAPGPGRPRPRIVPNYVHSKVGIADNAWATVGSANLDGSSLDFTQLLHAAHAPFGDVRNSEVNLVIVSDVDEQPQTGTVDLLRRRLWAEHLGFESAPGVPDPNDPDLAEPRDGGWLSLWNERAANKLKQLKEDPSTVSGAHVLPWPMGTSAPGGPNEHLKTLGVDTTTLDLDPILKTRKFDFTTGLWKSSVRVDPERYPEYVG